MRKPQVYIIAGPNGAGKTTFAGKFLPDYVECLEFINADLIAQGLAPLSPERAAIKAGKLLLERIHELAAQKQTFSFETTLSGKSHVRLLERLREQNFEIHLFYLWIPNSKLALARIKDRVRRGGHDVPRDVVERRIDRSLDHFLNVYKDLCDSWVLLDASMTKPSKIAAFERRELKIYDKILYKSVIRKACS